MSLTPGAYGAIVGITQEGADMADEGKEAESETKSGTNTGVENLGSGTINISQSAVGDQARVLVEAVATGTLGVFISAFCTEMGRRFGGTASDWVKRVHLRKKDNVPRVTELIVMVDRAESTIELPEGLPVEARNALLDLDIEAFRGHRLVWNTEVEAWIPAPPKRANS